MPEINGKQVTFKERLSNREAHTIMVLSTRMAETQADGQLLMSRAWDALGYDGVIRWISTLVESWEFEGDPGDPASYEALNYFTEVLPMFRFSEDVVGAFRQRQADVGESGSEST